MLTKLLNCNVIASTFVSLASVSLSRRKRKNKNESVLIESLFLNESKAREAEKELREGKKKNTVTNCSGNLDTKNNGLFQCQQCRLWTHAECAGNGECSKGKFIQSNEFSDEDRISLNIRSGTFITCNCGKRNNGYRIADTGNQKCRGQEYQDGQKWFSLVPAGSTLDEDGRISSPTASERYLGRRQERFLSLVPAVRIVRMHVLPSTADSEHASDTERYGIT
ncbi:hypothetical protein PV325_007645 [Microctonus aethiopoides]|nr:hypothetical protein PV325_007645 [Microctonus aethiopoides]